MLFVPIITSYHRLQLKQVFRLSTLATRKVFTYVSWKYLLQSNICSNTNVVAAEHVIRVISSFKIEHNLESSINAVTFLSSNSQNTADLWLIIDFLCTEDLKCRGMKM